MGVGSTYALALPSSMKSIETRPDIEYASADRTSLQSGTTIPCYRSIESANQQLSIVA
jgi:hypothetical protein